MLVQKKVHTIFGLKLSFSSYLLELLHKRQNLCKCFVEVHYALTKGKALLLSPMILKSYMLIINMSKSYPTMKK